MTKGGARTASSAKAVAKGMGIEVFFNVLKEINHLNDWVTTDQIMKNLHFGGERNETCRSYFKELWRYGLIIRKEKFQIIPCTNENWKKGGRPVYSISDKGKLLLSIPDKHKVFALAWILIKSDNDDDFPQLHKALEVFRKGEVPLNMFQASEVTGIVRDSIKAIMYGWLEPLGFLDRTNRGTFILDEEYYSLVNSFKNIKSATPLDLENKLSTENLEIETCGDLGFHDPDNEKCVNIPLKMSNSSINPLIFKVTCKVHPLFRNRFETSECSETFELKPKTKKEITINIPFKNKPVSESFYKTEIGFFELVINREVYRGALPAIWLTTKSHLYELNLNKLLAEIGFNPIPCTKSDRPDMIIYPNRTEEDLEKFLRNDETKILVETTSSDIVSLKKINEDLKNFKEHTTKVLKINASRTLIVGTSIAKNIENEVQDLLKNYHPFTIISLKDLEYIKYLIKNKRIIFSDVLKILNYNGIVKKEFINSFIN